MGAADRHESTEVFLLLQNCAVSSPPRGKIEGGEGSSHTATGKRAGAGYSDGDCPPMRKTRRTRLAPKRVRVNSGARMPSGVP